MWIVVGVGAFLLLSAFFLMLLILGIAFAMRRRKPKLWDALNQPLVANGALAAVLGWVGYRMTPPKPEGEDEGVAFIRARRAFEEKLEAQRLFSGSPAPPNSPPNG